MMSISHFVLFSITITIFLCILGSACSAIPTEPPLPTPQAITVSYTPAVRPLLNAISTCAVQQPGIVLFVNEVSAPFLKIQDSDLALRLGYPRGSTAFASPLIIEEIVFIVHPSNPVDILSTRNVVDIFTGKIVNWLEVRGKNDKVEVWINSPHGDLHQIVQDSLLLENPPTSLANLAPDPESMLVAVKSNPSAVGYLPRSWLSDEVKTVRTFPDTSVLLTRPVLALTVEEPQDEIRVLISCLQEGIGQEIIQDKYNWQNIKDLDFRD